MRICYLSHIDWNWIKQRPQFIAEGLTRDNTVDYYYFPSNAGDATGQNGKANNGNLHFYPLLKLPLSGRLQLVKELQLLINTLLIRSRCYDVVWVCSPEVSARVNILKLNLPIIYDCMDDMIECHSMPKYKQMLLSYENMLLSNAAHVFVSSLSLRAKMLARGCAEQKLTLVNNATNPASLLPAADVQPRCDNQGDQFVITYFGTISNWIDLELLYTILDDAELSNVYIKLIGPTDVSLRQHPRLEYIPPVPHDKLSTCTADADLFILPFKLNDITVSVDPVKMYEYIALHRNIAAVHYPELDRYAEFAHFYSNYDELKSIILSLGANNILSYDTLRADQFVAGNTWENRIDVILGELNALNATG